MRAFLGWPWVQKSALKVGIDTATKRQATSAPAAEPVSEYVANPPPPLMMAATCSALPVMDTACVKSPETIMSPAKLESIIPRA